MEPALGVALLWVVFGGTHVVLATARIRGALVARLGEIGFVMLYSLIAAASYAALVAYYAGRRFDGAPGLALAHLPVLRSVLTAVVVAGFMLMNAGLFAYPRLPSALFGQPICTPRGIERITRHPFFAGVALFALAHALLTPRLVGAVFTGGFALLALAGARHQDAKLRARRGPAYADYLAATSIMPFVAIVGGRQRLAWRELPLGVLAAGLALALGIRAVHDGLFAHGGAWMIGVLVGGAALAGWQSWRRARRLASRPAVAPAR